MPDPLYRVNPAQPPEIAPAGQTSAAPASSRPPRPAPAAADSADVARTETLLATIAAAAESIPEVDQARIAELQRALLSGTYQIDPQHIAQKIVELEQLLAAKGRQE
jgi:negative regulator of flagellin synthesis FlgM